jgi:hypothetical protein
MNFTNTKNVGKVVCKHLTRRMKAQLRCHVWSQVSQVYDQLDDQVFYQINPIKYKITQEINK